LLHAVEDVTHGTDLSVVVFSFVRSFGRRTRIRA
jgi:hypothetical protein